MTDQLEFPGPEPGDPEDVTWNLQTAGTMWNRGDAHEAIRWLRRAAEAAGNSGADLRAVTLARAAADLTSALDIPPSIPPPAPAPEAPAAPPAAAPEPSATPVPEAAPAASGSAPSHSAPAAARPSTRPGAGLRQRQALRVSVRPAESGSSELIVRALLEDESPGEGEHEAMLVALEAGAHLLSKKR